MMKGIVLMAFLFAMAVAPCQAEPALEEEQVDAYYTLYEGDCDTIIRAKGLFTDMVIFPLSKSDEYFDSFIRSSCDEYIERDLGDRTSQPGDGCAHVQSAGSIKYSVRVHRCPPDEQDTQVTCSTWTDKLYVCAQCSSVAYDIVLDRQTHNYNQFTCRNWIPSRRTYIDR